MKRILVCTIVAVLLSGGVAAAQKVSTETLLDLGRARSPKLEQALRDTFYDAAKTTQEFVQDPAEKDLPLWRVVTLNRN